MKRAVFVLAHLRNVTISEFHSRDGRAFPGTARLLPNPPTPPLGAATLGKRGHAPGDSAANLSKDYDYGQIIVIVIIITVMNFFIIIIRRGRAAEGLLAAIRRELRLPPVIGEPVTLCGGEVLHFMCKFRYSRCCCLQQKRARVRCCIHSRASPPRSVHIRRQARQRGAWPASMSRTW